MQFNELASTEAIEETIKNLKANGIDAEFVETGKDALAKVLEILPKGAEVMNMTSITLDQLGVAKEILESGNYNPVRSKLMDKAFPANEKRKLGAAPEWTVGSVNAVSEEGHVFIASNTGSQLPAYAYGAEHIIWVVSTDKIVKDMTTAIKRIYEYTLPLESERANKAYNMTGGSSVNKMLVVNKESQAGRIKIIFVNEVLGF